MIPFSFEYYQPGSVAEALDAFWALDAEGKTPVYYGGGSELISMARMNNLSFGAVIDLKGIPDCNVLEFRNDRLLLGAALPLAAICEARVFPLMDRCAGRVADHTMQCKITLGGNLAGTISYREASLPLLLTDSILTIACRNKRTDVPIRSVFRERLRLQKGEFLVSVSVPKPLTEAPYVHIKKTSCEKIDYPLLSTAGLKAGGELRVAFSGLRHFPFRDPRVEAVLNDETLTFGERAEKITRDLSDEILDDLWGTAGYRAFVLKNTLEQVLSVLKES